MASDTAQNINSNHIRFGKSMAINAGARLPQFDNGNALAYQAYNLNDKSKSFIAIISDIRDIPRWTSISAYNALSDTSFMRLIGSGIVNWKLDGKQKYVFIYDNNLGRPLLENGGTVDCHWRHPDIVNYLIHPIASILREMEGKSFAHGSIRPNNIFYSGAGQNAPIILGDGLSVHSESTQPSVFLPISKSLTDPMARGHASISGDIYAFGVSLFMFLSKNDNILKIDDEEILRRKVDIGSYAAIVGSERFPITFLELLRGVLHDDERLRWSVDDIFSWLDGVRLNPAPNPKKKKANRPVVFSGNKYLFAETLALDIHKNPREFAAMVDDGSFGQWITKSIDDSALTDRYVKALERAMGVGDINDNKDYLITQMRMALFPDLPLYYKGKCFTHCGLGAMMVQSICNGEKLSFYEEVLNLNLLDHALVSVDMMQGDMVSMLKNLDVCRAALRQKKYGYGIEKCVYLMCKNAPCLSPKFKGYFVNSGKSLLSAFEKICKSGKGSPFVMDMHLAAFFSVLNASTIDKYLFDLNSDDKNTQIITNLRILALMQKKSDISSSVAIAEVFEKSLSKVYKSFRNVKMRKTVKEGVKSAAKAGDLSGMVDILSDERTLSFDQKGFQIACYEYRALHNEYNEYNRRLANKNTYGVYDGHGVAVSVSWTISVVLTLIVVFAFLSGNQIF